MFMPSIWLPENISIDFSMSTFKGDTIDQTTEPMIREKWTLFKTIGRVNMSQIWSYVYEIILFEFLTKSQAYPDQIISSLKIYFV